MEAKIDCLGDEDSNLASYDSKDSSGNIRFWFHNKPALFTGHKNFKTYREDSVKIPGVTTPTGVVIQQAFEERKRKLLFKNIHYKSIKLDIRNVILLDGLSTMCLFFNIKLVGNIYKAKNKMRLQSNGGNMLINHESQVAGYKPHVWFDQKAITNLIVIKNLIKQYRFA